MKALFFRKKGVFELADAKKPKIKRLEDVLIRVEKAGICGTDIGIFLGSHPANPNVILGHEYTGTVIETGKGVKAFKKGDKVVVDPNLTCGICYYCRNGMTNQCEYLATGTTLGIFKDGGFAKYNVAPQSALYKIPKDMDFKSAALVEPLSCVLNGIKKVNIQPEDTVMIIGAGPIGALFADLAKGLASKVIISEIEESRIKHVKKFTKYVLNPKETNVLEDLIMITKNKKADVVIEATGALMEDALSYIKKGGKVLLFGMNYRSKAGVKPYDLTRNEIDIYGTFIANKTFDPAIKVLYNGKIDVDHYVSKIMPLSEIYDAFKLLGLDIKNGKKTERKAMKILIEP